jgi:hypothetical protein
VTLAVDMTLSWSRSRSVSGIRFTKTGTPAISTNADVPPMPDPIARAASHELTKLAIIE